MKSRHALKLDLNNFFKPAISDGLDDVSSFESEFKDIHLGVMALKQTGHLPYKALPEDDILKDNVIAMARRYPKVQNVIVFGIGGSALGAASIYQALKGDYAHVGQENSGPRLFIVDHIEPDTIQDLIEKTAEQDNLYVFISKSGNTSETLAQFLFLKKNVPDFNHDNLFIITDSHTGYLHDYAVEHDVIAMPIPSGVGGRFSVFSAAGLFPLAVSGIDVKSLLDGAAHMEALCQSGQLAQNPAGLLAMSLNDWQKKGRSQVVLMPYANRLRLVSDWFAQLWGESLGKAHTIDGQTTHLGSTPIKALGVTDQHSQLQLYLEGPKDKVVLFIDVEEFSNVGKLEKSKSNDDRVDFLSGSNLAKLLNAEKLATEESLRENDRPNASLKMSMINEFQLGQMYQLFMNVIPYMGSLMGINPFDQPAVERIKKFTFGLMGRKDFSDYANKISDHDKRFIF